MAKRQRTAYGKPRVYKYAAYPSREQREMFDKQATGYNRAYNFIVRVTEAHNAGLRSGHAEAGMRPAVPYVVKNHPWTAKILREQLTFKWNEAVYPLKDVHSVTVGAVNDCVGQAWAKVREERALGRPAQVRFRGRDDEVSLLTAGGTNVPVPAVRKVKGGLAWVKLPGLFGNLWKVRYHRGLPADAVVNLVRVKRFRDGRFEVILVTETDEYRRPQAKPGTVSGMDRGISLQVALSDGRYELTPGLDEAQRARYLALEQQCARQRLRAKVEHAQRCTEEGCRKKWHPSARYLKTRAEMRSLLRVSDSRMRDHLHKMTRVIADDYETVVIEDLKLKNMTRSARGTQEEPGVSVAAKSGLNRELLAASLGAIGPLLEQKGTRVVKVNPAYTSRTCPSCGHAEAANRRGTVFLCVNCEYKADADVNAAVNICERRGGDASPGQRSQAGQAPEFERSRTERVIPEAWGRPASRKRVRKHRSGRVK